MPAKKNLTGLVFGRLTVIDKSNIQKANSRWNCICSCGNKSVVIGSKLISGHTKSCGCLRSDVLSSRKTHGLSDTPTYYSWQHLVDRCTNEKNKAYPKYGQRGISVCDRWRIFDNFLQDMGEKPNGTSIDRIDNNGNYEPGNCRWADRKTQNNNTRSNVIVVDGLLNLTLSEFCNKYNLNYGSVKSKRLRANLGKVVLSGDLL